MMRQGRQFSSLGFVLAAAAGALACGNSASDGGHETGGTGGAITGGRSSSASGGLHSGAGGTGTGGLASNHGGATSGAGGIAGGAGGTTNGSTTKGGTGGTADSTAPSGGSGASSGAKNGGTGGVPSGDGGKTLGPGGESAVTGGLHGGGTGGIGGGNGTTDANDFFALAVNYPLPKDAVSVQIADLDGDGTRDLIVATQVIAGSSTDWSLNVLHNKGKGTFEAGDSYAQTTALGAFIAGDFNGDGAVDVITSNSNGGALHFLQNLGNGKLKASVDLTVTTTNSFILSADLNGDHKLDLIFVRDTKIAFALNVGAGAFAEPQPICDRAEVDGVAAGDLTGDGSADVVTRVHPEALKAFITSPSGVFAAPVSYSNPTPSGVASVLLADLDGDARADVLTYTPGKDSGPGFASVLLNRGDGTLTSAQTYDSGAMLDVPTTAGVAGTGPIAAATGDLDGDGKLDLLFANPGGRNTSGNFGVRLNAGGGKFPNLNTYSVGAYPNQIFAAELSGDKKADVVFVDHGKLFVRLTK
ncbi:MAG TPA: VCBS repeat-containing protein [Polyangiaceae bacterium]|nr:VCBS repeat-containing protein [Polyangiaceae bacterium]